MGLPQIKIVFETLAVSAVTRSEKGIVAILINDSIATKKSFVFNSLADVDMNDFEDANFDYIRICFEGKPIKVLVEVVSEDLGTTLKSLIYKKFNYICYPYATSVENDIIKSWIFEQRRNNKMKKGVLANCQADDESIINFTTKGIKVGERIYSPEEYCVRIAGIVAGLPVTRSATYYILNEVDEIIHSETPDADINNGKLILTNDGEKIKIGRGVNSLVSTTTKKSEEFTKIKLVETMDLILEDIKTTFENEYVGKVNNSYDNKCLFINSVNAYFKQLQKEEMLDPNNDAYIEVDVDAQRLYLQGRGTDVSLLTEAEIKFANTGSKVFLKGTCKVLDSMEDLEFYIHI